MSRMNFTGSSPGFVVDYNGATRNGGRQIDWNKLDDSYRQGKQTVKANGAAAAGATSITVDALPVDIPLGTILNFGTYAPVTVTTTGVAAAAATSIPVAALSGSIPSGTILNFTGSGEFALLTADADAGATSLTVEALDAEIESGDTASFKGGTKQARLTAAASAGGTTLAVDELQFAVANDAEATFGGVGSKVVRAGTIMAELASGRVIPRRSVTGAETASMIIVSTVEENARQDAATGYGMFIGGAFYRELMPDRDETDFDTWIGEIRTNGGWVRLEKYSDSRAA
jgi:hypothetical protein